jgi:ATP-binding cassette, subfamily B, bacterial
MIDVPRLLVGRRRWLLAALVANGFGQAALAAATALLAQQIFDGLVGGAGGVSSNDVLIGGAGLVGAGVFSAALRARERADAERLGQRYVHSVRMACARHLLELSPRALQRRSHGAVTLRFVGDLSALRQWVTMGLARLTVGFTVVVGALSALAVISAPLALTAGVVLALGAAGSLLLGPRMRRAAREARRRRAWLAANVNEKVSAAAVVQAFDQGRRERRRLSRQSRALREAMVERARVGGRLQGMAEGTAAVASTAALLVGALQVQSGHMSGGTVVGAMLIVHLLVPRLSNLGRVQEYWHNSRVALERLKRFLATPTLLREIPDAPALVAERGELEFKEVGLDGALHGVSAVAKAGRVVAVVGPNGAGKSTLLALAGRLLDPDRGQVLIDGHDLAAHDPGSVRRLVGMAGPDLPLLRGSIRRNLTYRCPEAGEEELCQVIELCELGGLLKRLPEGLDTRVSDLGRSLSAGERQRIALARALGGDPRVLLLDEVEGNLDRRAQRAVMRVIDLRRERATILLATHRPELIAYADCVWDLEADGVLQVTSPAEWLCRRRHGADPAGPGRTNRPGRTEIAGLVAAP